MNVISASPAYFHLIILVPFVSRPFCQGKAISADSIAMYMRLHDLLFCGVKKQNLLNFSRVFLDLCLLSSMLWKA